MWWQAIRPSVPASHVTEIPDGEEQKLTDNAIPEVKDIYVYVTGAVQNPGVYCMKEGQRVYEVLGLAVLRDDAELSLLMVMTI